MSLMAAMLGALLVAGILLLVLGLRKTPERPQIPKPPLAERWARLTRRPTGRAGKTRDIKLLAGVVAGIVAWLVTGWLLAVLLVPLAVFGIPALLRDPSDRELKRLEAIAQWVGSLRGQLTVGAGLEQAIQVSVSSVPGPIRPEVEMLVARLNARWEIREALREFADELGDDTGDRVAMDLIAGAQLRGPGLSNMLDALSTAINETVEGRRKAETDLAKSRASARIVSIITIGILGVATLMRTYMQPYSTPLGQFILAILLTGYVACLMWMRRLGTAKPAPRLLQKADRR